MPQTIQQLLKNNQIDSLDVELLLAHILKRSREFIISHPNSQVNFLKIQQFKKLLKKRQQNIPLAYLTGHKEFFGLDFLVNKNVLIPRPETEILVEEVLKIIKNDDILIDVGTGSGCIPISIVYHCDERSDEIIPIKREVAMLHAVARNDINFFAIDISKSALTVAKQNANKHQTKIKFLYGNLLKPITKYLQYIQQLKQLQHLIITANLPYLTSEQFKNEKSIQQEPKRALIAGKDGLKYYKQLLKQVKSLFINYQLPITLFLEIDPSQTKTIKLLIKKYFPKTKIIIHQDLAGKNRVVKIKIVAKIKSTK